MKTHVQSQNVFYIKIQFIDVIMNLFKGYDDSLQMLNVDILEYCFRCEENLKIKKKF